MPSWCAHSRMLYFYIRSLKLSNHNRNFSEAATTVCQVSNDIGGYDYFFVKCRKPLFQNTVNIYRIKPCMLQRTSKFKLKDKIFYTGNPKLITNQN
jgi:hypothetical protein